MNGGTIGRILKKMDLIRQKYSIDEIKEKNYNIDLCGYPHEEEEILPPKELIQQYQEKRASLNADIDRILAQITDILGIELEED